MEDPCQKSIREHLEFIRKHVLRPDEEMIWSTLGFFSNLDTMTWVYRRGWDGEACRLRTAANHLLVLTERRLLASCTSFMMKRRLGGYGQLAMVELVNVKKGPGTDLRLDLRDDSVWILSGLGNESTELHRHLSFSMANAGTIAPFSRREAVDPLCPNCFEPFPQPAFICPACGEACISTGRLVAMAAFFPGLFLAYRGEWASGIAATAFEAFTWWFSTRLHLLSLVNHHGNLVPPMVFVWFYWILTVLMLFFMRGMTVRETFISQRWQRRSCRAAWGRSITVLERHNP